MDIFIPKCIEVILYHIDAKVLIHRYMLSCRDYIDVVRNALFRLNVANNECCNKRQLKKLLLNVEQEGSIHPI